MNDVITAAATDLFDVFNVTLFVDVFAPAVEKLVPQEDVLVRQLPAYTQTYVIHQ